MKIMFNDLSKQWNEIKFDVKPRFEKLFNKSDFIGGMAIAEFEKNFAKYCGTKFAVGISNGTDALKIALAALRLEGKCGIIIPANTFIATALAPTYISDLDYWTDEIINHVNFVDIAILDGTFYTNEEIPSYRQILHPPIMETMELLKESTTDIYFTHFNHTNPIVRSGGKERKEVKRRGFKIAYDGLIFNF